MNGTQFARFNHRVRPDEITNFRITGDVDFPSPIIYHSKFVIIPPAEMFWRTLGSGHLLQVSKKNLHKYQYVMLEQLEFEFKHYPMCLIKGLTIYFHRLNLVCQEM